MANYRPNVPFNVPMFLFAPKIEVIKGVAKKIYPDNGDLIYCSFRTFGGTESKSNGVLVVEDTAIIETWYRPDIKSDCILKNENGDSYEILGTPENINMRNQIMKFKIRKVSGGV
jgi:hypothetical protein|nr:MAG TPA: PORTAL PROTEIN, 15 PROTEIN, HEAD PROTEIN, TAILED BACTERIOPHAGE, SIPHOVIRIDAE.6A [Caudoviricetes sp.]